MVDPKLGGAFKLMFSETAESEEQLRTMLDDAIKQRYGNDRTLTAYYARKRGREEDEPTDRGPTDKNTSQKLAEESTGESPSAKRRAGSGTRKSSHSKRVSVGSSTLSASDKLMTTAIKTEPEDIPLENVKQEPINQDEAEEDYFPCGVCGYKTESAQNKILQCWRCLFMYHQQCHEPPIDDSVVIGPMPTFCCAPCVTKEFNDFVAQAESSGDPFLKMLLGEGKPSAAEREFGNHDIPKLISAEKDAGESSGIARSSGSNILKSSHSKQVFGGASTSSASDDLVMPVIKTEPVAIKTEPVAIKTEPVAIKTEPEDIEAQNVKQEPVNQDEETFALDLLEDDLSCVVCRAMDISAGNQMLECAGCHSLYHQECHRPPVADTEINYPRPAWYCTNCQKCFNNMESLMQMMHQQMQNQ